MHDRVAPEVDPTGPFGEWRAAAARASPAFIGGLATLLLRPWFDALALPGIVRWYFPLSRAWAAAAASGSDVERFRVELPEAALPERMIALALAAAQSRRRAHDVAARDWEDAFFPAAREAVPWRLAELEHRRAAAAQSWMAMRSAFLPLHLHRTIPGVRWQATGESEVEARHGGRLGDPSLAFPARPEPALATSRRIVRNGVATSWLRFPTTVAGQSDTAWARVIEPANAAPHAPALVFLHGVGVETEFWNADLGRIDGFIRAGIRVIRPEAPWHGRRRLPGWFGGEPVMAWGPLGLLGLFEAWVGEVAQLVAWARATGSRVVAVGGVSLGALTSQLLATVAGLWPAAMRPDALLLVGTTADVVAAATEGSLARALGAGRTLAAHGWTQQMLQRWAPLLQPQLTPVMSPDAIVMVIGTSDRVTPFDGGLALARRWALPRENLFLRHQGHFSVALGLEHDAAPLDRLAAILRRRSP